MCQSLLHPSACQSVDAECSLAWVKTTRFPPCTTRVLGIRFDFPPIFSRAVPLQSCLSDPKREHAAYYRPSWLPRCAPGWVFQFWGSSCTRDCTSSAYASWPSWSFAPRGSVVSSHIEKGKCNHRTPTRLPRRLRQTMPYDLLCARADACTANASRPNG